MMEQGLAAMSAGVTNTYGDGKDNTVKHYYAGSKPAKKKKKGK